MENEILSLNEPITFSDTTETSAESAAAETAATELEEVAAETVAEKETAATESAAVIVEFPEDMLTNETYINGINELVNTIDPDAVNEEIYYVDRGSFYSLPGDLPDYACVYQCNGIDVVFPTEYAEQIYISDGMLVNLGSNYTAGLQLEGYEVSNYLSSELTIPTYHSSTWYQYMQSYGQPYRIVDRYVNSYGSISSSTRSSVAVEWSGGNPWEGFTFDRAAMFIVMVVLLIMLVFRKGRR